MRAWCGEPLSPTRARMGNKDSISFEVLYLPISRIYALCNSINSNVQRYSLLRIRFSQHICPGWKLKPNTKKKGQKRPTVRNGQHYSGPAYLGQSGLPGTGSRLAWMEWERYRLQEELRIWELNGLIATSVKCIHISTWSRLPNQSSSSQSPLIPLHVSQAIGSCPIYVREAPCFITLTTSLFRIFYGPFDGIRVDLNEIAFRIYRHALWLECGNKRRFSLPPCSFHQRPDVHRLYHEAVPGRLSHTRCLSF
ncbi:hypothetical protein F5887DRAFT_974004 [Amanita rubescens]|nr:hypothetical protein F5887DRAFT_974004 [Amanita rubescens]